MGIDAPLLSKTLGGRFKITGHIGEGAMASVFRGVDLQKPSDADVAVKVMHPHLASDRTFTARFKREAQAASMVKHPNTVSILDVGEEAGVHYIVMELCRGRDLRETLKAAGRFPAPRAVRVVMTICDALAAAHKLGVVHRDLKPENVMIEHDPAAGTDLVKVLDFGIAKLVDAEPKVRMGDSTDSDPPPALTQMGVVVGTPQYMSPEQCRGQPLDGRSDVYTCGILLYQLVTGTLPFNSESPFEVAGKQAFEPPPPPSQHLPSIDPDLEGIILRTLSKAADQRPQSAREMFDILQRWLDSHASGARPSPAAADEALRGLQRTMPINKGANELKSAVDDYIAAGGAPRPPQPPTAPRPGPFQASGPFQPSSGASGISAAVDAQGPLGTQVAMEAITAPPAQRAPLPAAGRPMMPSSPQSSSIDVSNVGHAPSLPDPLGPPPAEDPAAAAVAAPQFGAIPAPPPTVQDPSAQMAKAAPAKEGWGIFGVLMILLSLGAGVGLGYALYLFAPF